MKVTLVLLALIATTVLATQHVLPAQADRTADNIYPFIDNGLKDKYWYYLTKACLLYLTSVERGEDYQFLAIYRNIVGTFLAITTWNDHDEHFTVNTLVRLGNGYQANSGARYKPVAVAPLKLRYSLGPEEFIIEVSDCGDIKINDKVLGQEEEKPKVTEEMLVEQCRVFSAATVDKFWYYLDQAKVVYSSVGRTGNKNYCLITYLNYAGTFLVIGTVDEQESTHISTFVRLGNGDPEGVNYEPVAFRKIKLPLQGFA